MVRSGRTPWVRIVVATLVVVAGMCWFASSARANGCHVPDRPTFGLPHFLETVAHPEVYPDLDAGHAPAYSPIPCDGESPGTISIFALAPPLMASGGLRIEAPRPTPAIAIASTRLMPSFRTSPPVRPPRSISV